MDKLLPCPFCGGEAIHDTITMVCCKICFATAPASKWNTRHTPEGWQLVPTHRPTIDMTEAGMCHVMRGQDYERAQACWLAMLAAAPKWGGE